MSSRLKKRSYSIETILISCNSVKKMLLDFIGRELPKSRFHDFHGDHNFGWSSTKKSIGSALLVDSLGEKKKNLLKMKCWLALSGEPAVLMAAWGRRGMGACWHGRMAAAPLPLTAEWL